VKAVSSNRRPTLASPSRVHNPHQSRPPTNNPRRHRWKEEHPHLDTDSTKTTRGKVERLRSTKLIRRDRMSEILDMQRPQSSVDSCLLPAITNHILNMIIVQVMLINRSRLATYANHAFVTHAVYDTISCHDYNVVNIIQVYTLQTITMSRVLCLNAANESSSISEDVTEIQINSQPCKGNNMTTQHTRATKANEWLLFTMTIKESGRVLPHPSAIFHAKASRGSPWVA
jgi:hypothetical protein